MSVVANYLKDPGGVVYNVLAILYILMTYIGGWYLMSQSNIIVNLVGVILCGHAMVIAAYMIHECAHNSIFKRAEHNAKLGKVLSWFTGSCYGTYEDIRSKHIHHHVENCDAIIFDYRSFLKRHRILEKTVFALEWACVPAVEIIMHAMLLTAPFIYASKSGQRVYLIKVIVTRVTLFALLCWLVPRAVIGYIFSYFLMLTVLRFMDGFQHNYEVLINLDNQDALFPHKGDRDYEERNTYTNFISKRWPWFNLLALNFSYHNAHHTRPVTPWYRLPALHRELYGDGEYVQELDFKDQLISFHRNRLARVYSETYGEVEVQESIRQGSAVGVNALSFLTAF